MPSKIRKAVGALKDKTSIGLAKVGNSNTVSDLDVAIVKATRHDEYPAEEKHIREILSLTCYSRTYISSCVSTLSRRLGKTKSWTVALKTLMLIHRLLSEGDPQYEQEIFFSTRRGTRMLNMSDFRDTSRSDAWDFSAFVRTYARYLDERLEFRMHGRRPRRGSRSKLLDEDDEEDSGGGEKASSSKAIVVSVKVTPVRDMKTERIFVRTQHLMHLMEKFLACRPTGAARNSRIIALALYPLVKESYQLYFDITEIMGIFIDRFMELEVPECVKIYEIFSRLSKQFDELDIFYSWCKSAGISRPSEFPDIEKITQQKLDIMDDFIRDKSALAQSKKKKSLQQLTHEEDAKMEEERVQADYESSAIKALPAPEAVEEKELDEEAQVNENAIVSVTDDKRSDEEVDLLNLRADVVTVQEHGDKLALALFDGSTPAAAPAWDAFPEESADWETALVQSASNLGGQKASLGGGFDMLLLDGMYSQPRPQAMADVSGSASSVALPKTQPMLALPAPPVSGGGGVGGDPFAASLAVPPPSYVQMSEMERKQQLLVEEQAMWQQYARDGMPGQAGLVKLQATYPINGGGGGYIHRF